MLATLFYTDFPGEVGVLRLFKIRHMCTLWSHCDTDSCRSILSELCALNSFLLLAFLILVLTIGWIPKYGFGVTCWGYDPMSVTVRFQCSRAVPSILRSDLMRVPSKECLSAVAVRSVHPIVSSATAVPSLVPMAGPDHIPQISLDHHIHLTSLLMAGPWDIRTAHPLWLLKKGGSRWNLGYRKPCETSRLLPFRSSSVYRVGCASYV